MEKNKILLTGATGFIGSHLLRSLALQEQSVAIVVRQSSDISFIKKYYPDVEILYWTNNEKLVSDIVTYQPDIVYHLATLFVVKHDVSQVQALIEANIELGTLLFEACLKKAPRRFVTTGTSWQYDVEGQVFPANLYAATKQAMYSISQYYSQHLKSDIVWLQLFDSFGPFDPRKKLIHLLRTTAAEKSTLKLSPGEQHLDLLYVADIVDALIFSGIELQLKKSLQPNVFGVANPKRHSLKAIVELFEQSIGAPVMAEWGALAYRENEIMMPWTPKKPLPGWRPKYSLEAAFSEMMDIEKNGADNYWSVE